MTAAISEFFENDDKKIEELIKEYPVSIPTDVAAKFLGINPASMRAIMNDGTVGLSWKKEGKLNRGFYLPTAHFLRWYIKYGV